MQATSFTLTESTARKGTNTMDRETYEEEVQQAAQEDDQERMAELERMEVQGRVGEDSDPPLDAEEAFEREVDRAVRSGDKDRLDELERMEAEGEIEKAMRTSVDVQTRLDAAINEASDSDFRKQLESIREAGDVEGALQSALQSATGDRYETLIEIQKGL